jgi:hypothetical protein
MIGRRVVALVAVFGLSVLVCSGLVGGSAAAAPRAPRQVRSSRALVLHLKWQVVARGSTAGAAANERYVAIVQAAGASVEIRLIDEQTGTRHTLTPRDCAAPDNEGPPLFGGRWLMFSCGPEAYQLYDLASGQWRGFAPSPQCGYSPPLKGTCTAVGVGSGWVKLVTSFGCDAHCRLFFYLQNILTGELIPDPITPGGTTLDDLNSASGSVPLCPPLRYPKTLDKLGWELGKLQFSGPFALAYGVVHPPSKRPITVYHLERCGSHLTLTLPEAELGVYGSPPLLSSRAVVSLGLHKDHCMKRPFGLACTSHYYLRGVYLGGLRRFTAALPRTTVPQYSLPGQVVGLTRRRIYVEAPYPDGPLWAATLPTPARSRHHH